MKNWLRFGVSNPVLGNLLFVGVIALGLMSMTQLPREVFPEFTQDAVDVEVVYPNASPLDMERLVVMPLEEAADGITGTDEIQSFSQQGIARMFIQLKRGTSMEEYLDEFRQEVDSLKDWPEQAERPSVREKKMRFPVVNVNLFGNIEASQVRPVAERIRDRIREVDHVATVGLLGLGDPVVQVLVTPTGLQRWGMTLDEVALALGFSVKDFPAGVLRTSAGEVRLRVPGETVEPSELEGLILRDFGGGAVLRLRDLAEVRIGEEIPTTLSRYNGLKTVTLPVTKDSEGDVIDMVRDIETLAKELAENLPAGVSLGLSSDFSIYVRNRLNTLLQSGLIGLALVLLMLWVFLDARTALITAVGIPIAVMGGMVFMNLAGMTMNMLSMFSFILVLGMVVDDAVVVVENCYRHLERGMRVRDAAILGVQEVAWPVVTTILTTIVAFGAMLMVTGEMGSFLRPVPWVAGLTLLASLIEALAILPSHFAEWVPELNGVHSHQRKRGRWYDPIQSAYTRMLRMCIRHRLSTAAGALGLLVCALALFQSGHLKFVLMPKFESKLFFVDVETSASNSVEQTSEILRHVDQAVEKLEDGELESVVTLAGALYADQTDYELGGHLGQVFVELSESEQRTRTTEEVRQFLRDEIGSPPEIRSLTFSEPNAGPVGPPIELRLAGEDPASLDVAAEEVLAYLSGFPGVLDLKDDRLSGPKEIRLIPSEEGRRQGITEAILAQQVLGSFYGNLAQRVRVGRDSAEMRVQFPNSARESFEGFDDLMVRSPAGHFFPLGEIAKIERTMGPSKITRRDRERAVLISAGVSGNTNAREIIQATMAHFSDLSQTHPGVELVFGGDHKTTQESLDSLAQALGMAAIIIWFLLAFLFRSYALPFVVMAGIPFAFLGVVFGFTAIGQPLTFMAMLGGLALTGIAVNDALVLVDFIRRHRLEGHGRLAAVLRAGTVRMRPVLITSITTIGGLMPLAFFSTGQARFLAPMAKAMVFGMLSATLMTLLLIPVGYLLLGDVRKVVFRMLGMKPRPMA